MFLTENAGDLSRECGYLENDINSLYKKFKNILVEQNEDFLDYIKNEEENVIERNLNK